MHILQAVHCPADRGDKPYVGRIMDVGETLHINHQGIPFRWITVRRDDTLTKHIWPSHRLRTREDTSPDIEDQAARHDYDRSQEG